MAAFSSDFVSTWHRRTLTEKSLNGGLGSWWDKWRTYLHLLPTESVQAVRFFFLNCPIGKKSKNRPAPCIYIYWFLITWKLTTSIQQDMQKTQILQSLNKTPVLGAIVTCSPLWVFWGGRGGLGRWRISVKIIYCEIWATLGYRKFYSMNRIWQLLGFILVYIRLFFFFSQWKRQSLRQSRNVFWSFSHM